jgi:hypothetical protein
MAMAKYSLLTESNPKLLKGVSAGYLPVVLHLAPFNLSGYQMCPMAELAGCTMGCLNTAGRGGIVKKGETTNAIQEARVRKTRLLVEHREEFMALLRKDIRKAQRRAKRLGLTLSVRLNGTSDLDWTDLIREFSEVQFYDYVKTLQRKRLGLANYHLTFSHSGVAGWQQHTQRAMDMGLNVAVVFRKALPAEFMGRPVVNGDETDLRFLDRQGVVVGLKAKGWAKLDTSGFVVA